MTRGHRTRTHVQGAHPTAAIARLLALASCGIMFFLAATASASAAILHVTSSADTGTGSLRAVVAAANSGDTIVIDPSVNPSLSSDSIAIESTTPFSLTIEGQGARSTTVNANGLNQIFFISNLNGPTSPANVTLTLSHMTLTGGLGSGDFGDGGGLEIDPGNVSLVDVAVTHNVADSAGGGIYLCGGSLSLTGVSIVGNTAGFSGGGIETNCTSSTIQMTNTTIAGNIAGDATTNGTGGGLELSGKLSSATLTDDTVFGNTAGPATGSAGGNLDLSAATASLTNTIIAGGMSPSGANCSGTVITSHGDNLEDSMPSQCGLSAGNGDLIGVTPMFHTSTPSDNGGETDTLALSPGSPAIDRVPASLCGATTDQRGMPRPGTPSTACDIGAYELYSTPLVVGCSPTSALVGTPTSCAATATGVAGAGLGPPTGSVTFSSDTPGSFSGGGSCVLVGGPGPTAGCAVTYAPAAFGTGTHRILATYGGDATYSVGSASAVLGVTRRADSASAGCSRGTVPIGGSTTCTVTVTDAQQGGAASAPSGSVGFSSDAAGSFSGGGSCALSGAGTTAGCSVTFTPSRNDTGTLSVTARYAGDATHEPATGATSVATSPVSGVTGNITVLEGTVIVTEPAGPTPHAAGAAGPVVTSVPLKGQTVSIPMGSTIDARKGEVALATAADYKSAQNSHHSIQTGVFQASMFTVRQLTARQELNRLRKKHKRRLTGIPATGLVLANPPGAAAAARCRRTGPPGKGIVRSLHGTAKGNYETIGAASTTTITNGLWTVEDRCDGTLTEVGRGRATVTPTHGAHRTSVVVNHGQAVIVKARFLPLKGISKGQAVRVTRMEELGTA